jgi:DNA-binding MarR family transcriptional regulator
MDKRNDLTDAEVLALERLLRVSRELREISRTFPVSFIETFATVALHPGHGPFEYAKRLETIPPIASKALSKLGERGRREEDPYGLLTPRDDPQDTRKVNYFLSSKGKSMVKKLAKAMGT